MGRDGHLVSVVIPTLGRSTLKDCQDALKAQDRPPDEVIIVLDRNRRGSSWARNEGIRRSKGDLIAFTDDDCVPPADWLKRLIEAIDRHDAAAVGGTFDETDPLLRAKHRRRRFPETERIDTEGWVGNTGNIIYRRTWLDECEQRDGYIFNETFTAGSGEDIEFIWRLRQVGAKIVFVPNAVTHLRRVTPGKYFSHQFMRGKGIAQVFLAQRTGDPSVVVQKSLIYGRTGLGKAVRWLKVAWRKAVGPFDARSFASRRQFAVFWLGEKCEGAGFLLFLARWWAHR